MAPELDLYLSQLRHQRGLSERTLALYAEALGKLERGCSKLGCTLLGLRPPQARELLAQLHGGGLKPSTLALTLSAWRGFYKWLALQQRIGHDPLLGLKAPKRGRPLPKALAVDDAVALANWAGSAEPEGSEALQARDHALVELLYGAGLRIGELLALDVDPRAPSHVDLANGEIQVVGKGSKPRRVPLGTQARKAVEAWLQQRALIAKPEEPALFVGSRGQRLQAGVARKQLAALARSAGLPTHVHPHMLRHSYASHLLQSSGDLRGVQELLGHANISTTQVYTRLDWQHLAKVYDAAHPRAKKR